MRNAELFVHAWTCGTPGSVVCCVYPSVHPVTWSQALEIVKEINGLDTGLIRIGTIPEWVRAVLPLSHPLASAPFVTLNDLVKEPFLLLEEGALSEPLEAFRAAGLEPSVRMCVHDDYSILSMIEAGLGVSILPDLVLQKTSYQVAILPINPTLTRKIGLIIKDSNTLPIASKYFIDFLLENADYLP